MICGFQGEEDSDRGLLGSNNDLSGYSNFKKHLLELETSHGKSTQNSRTDLVLVDIFYSCCLDKYILNWKSLLR